MISRRNLLKLFGLSAFPNLDCLSHQPQSPCEPSRAKSPCPDTLDSYCPFGVRSLHGRSTQAEFHRSNVPTRVICGGIRSGKTVAAAIEVASAALGRPFHAPDGLAISRKYPNPPSAICLTGFDLRHIARMQRKLFNPGLFRLIEDEKTGKLRAWQPWRADDANRQAETTPAPPLIPTKMVADCVSEERSRDLFRSCRLRNGTEFQTSLPCDARIPEKTVDLLWIDESIYGVGLSWLQWVHRCVRSIIWSTCHGSEAALLSREAWEHFPLWYSDNPYTPCSVRKRQLQRWRQFGEHVCRNRDHGDFI